MMFHSDKLLEFKADIDAKKEINQLQLSGLMIHLADLSSPTKAWKISKVWSQRCCKEFSSQNKQEISLKLPITPFYKNLDDKKTMANGEKCFI